MLSKRSGVLSASVRSLYCFVLKNYALSCNDASETHRSPGCCSSPSRGMVELVCAFSGAISSTGAHVMCRFVESWHILELAGTGPTKGNYCRLVCLWCKSAKFLESLLKEKIERHYLKFVFLGGQNILLFPRTQVPTRRA